MHRRKAGTEAPAKLGRSMHRNSSRSCKMVVTLGIREFASNDRHVFLEVVVRSWTNSHRNEVELVNRFCMVGPRQAVYMVTAVLVHLAYLVSYYLRWQLYSAVPQFPVFWPSEMTSATFCESSPTVQSHSPVPSPVPSPVHRIETAYSTGGKQERKRQPNLAGACIETVQEAAKWL